MFQYANDHNQNYPDGKSSTEVFQKLIDGGYISDPAIFYIPMVGKIKAGVGQRLKPENVCWDVTSPVDSSAPDGLPIVFSTGYKVNYVPGGAAIPFKKPGLDQRTQLGKLLGMPPLFSAIVGWCPEISASSKNGSIEFNWLAKLLGMPLLYSYSAIADWNPGGAIAVCYKSNSASFVIVPYSSTTVNHHGPIPNFVPADFDAKGKTYRQLTPDGVLPDK